jgi:DNA-binding XRE family transcriptional regulator
MPRRDPLLTALGRRVRTLRETQGLTQEQLGEKADLDQTYISDIERGERNPSVLIVGQLAKAFRLSLAELFAGRRSDRCSSAKDSLAMEGEKLGRRRKGLGWNFQRLADEIDEAAFQNGLREMLLEFLAKDEAQLVVERDQSTVEGAIVEPRKADAVPLVEAFVGVALPRKNVAGDQKLAHSNPGNAAAAIEGVEHHLPEELLPAARGNQGRDIGWAGGRSEHFANPHPDAFYQIDLIVRGSPDQRAERFFGQRHHFVMMLLKLRPDLAIQIARAREPFPSTRLHRRIERGQIAELHRHASRRAVHVLGDVLDEGLGFVELTKRNLLVNVQHHEQFVATPAFASGHGRSFCDQPAVFQPGFF